MAAAPSSLPAGGPWPVPRRSGPAAVRRKRYCGRSQHTLCSPAKGACPVEFLVFAVGSTAIVALIAFLAPDMERTRRPVRHLVGRDPHLSRARRASLSAQVAWRDAPRPRHVQGSAVGLIEAPDVPPRQHAAASRPAPFQPPPALEDPAPPLHLPSPAVLAPRLGGPRHASESLSRNQRERHADSLVVSLLEPHARAS